MRIGGKVTYIDADGGRHTATIIAPPGTGKSGFKSLTLDVKGEEELPDVPHEADAEPGAGFWREVGAKEIAEEDRPVPNLAPKKRAKRK